MWHSIHHPEAYCSLGLLHKPPGHSFPDPTPWLSASGTQGLSHSATCPLRGSRLPVCLALLPEEPRLGHGDTHQLLRKYVRSQ